LPPPEGAPPAAGNPSPTCYAISTCSGYPYVNEPYKQLSELKLFKRWALRHNYSGAPNLLYQFFLVFTI